VAGGALWTCNRPVAATKTGPFPFPGALDSVTTLAFSIDPMRDISFSELNFLVYARVDAINWR
jgi:hypothetical protein